MKRDKRPQKKNPATLPAQPPPDPGIENTGTLLIRAAESIEKFDAQLKKSQVVSRQIRRELDPK